MSKNPEKLKENIIYAWAGLRAVFSTLSDPDPLNRNYKGPLTPTEELWKSLPVKEIFAIPEQDQRTGWQFYRDLHFERYIGKTSKA